MEKSIHQELTTKLATTMSEPRCVLQEPKEWSACLEAGTTAIRRPYEIAQFPRRGVPCLVVYHLPIFTDCCAWSLFRKKDSFSLQTVIWRRSVDARRHFDPLEGVRLGISPAPILEERFEPTDSAWCISQLQELVTIHLSPFVPDGGIRLDGETFGVHIPGQIDLEWWCSGPAEWHELISWTNGFIGRLREPGKLRDG